MAGVLLSCTGEVNHGPDASCTCFPAFPSALLKAGNTDALSCSEFLEILLQIQIHFGSETAAGSGTNRFFTLFVNLPNFQVSLSLVFPHDFVLFRKR